jgi:hypothetical protein
MATAVMTTAIVISFSWIPDVMVRAAIGTALGRRHLDDDRSDQREQAHARDDTAGDDDPDHSTVTDFAKLRG